LSEDWFQVVMVDCSIASISPFRVDILLSSENVQFGFKMTRMEPDNKIELRKIFRLLYLSPGQHLTSRKVLKVFVIHNNTDEID